MIDYAYLAQRTQSVLGLEETPIVGILGLQDDYLKVFTSGVASGTLSDALGGELTDSVVGAAGIYGARELNAREQGVSIRMVVAVTSDAIHLLSLAPTGQNPGRELMRFDRRSTTARARRFGLSTRLDLHDTSTGQKIGLTGSLAFFSAYAAGTKAILAALVQ